MSTEDSTRGER